jgi:uncharacterized protein (DUF934 family)
MPLLKDGKITEDVWAAVEDGQELPESGPVLVSLARLKAEHASLLAGNHSVGVKLANSDDPAEIAPWLDRISLVALDFPKYTDGRALSQAQLLRRRHGYTGEVRATGQELRDQLRLMIRTGFDAMVIDQADAEAVFDFSAHEFSDFYQSAADTTDTIFVKRQRARQAKAAE